MARYNHESVVEVIPPGVYDAVVKKAEDDVSKSGNDMIRMLLTVYTPAGIPVDVWDYLVFSDKVLYKVKHFCESAGIDFKKNSLEADECVEKNVRVKLKIDQQEGYSDKNVVADYVKRNGAASSAPAKPAADPDIPF